MGHRAAYRTEEARQELAFHLKSTGLLRTIDNEEQRAVHNWGVYLCNNLGVSDTNYEVVIFALVDAILGLPIDEQATERD